MRQRLRALLAVATACTALAGAPSAGAQESFLFQVDPATAITATFDAIGEDSQALSVSGTLEAALLLDQVEIVSFEPTGGSLGFDVPALFSIVAGPGLSQSGGALVDLTLQLSGLAATPSGPARPASPLGGGLSEVGLENLFFTLDAGSFVAGGEALDEIVSQNVGLGSSPITISTSSGTGRLDVVDAGAGVRLDFPVDLAVLVVPTPMPMVVRLAGSLVMTGSLVACADGFDNDGDGRVDGQDPGCDASGSDPSERSATLECDDGQDNDGDGGTDYVADADGDGISDPPGDPGCTSPAGIETPICQDGQDNDGDAGIDFDGGAFANGGVALGEADLQCNTPYRNKEGKCGLGPGLLPAAFALLLWRRRERL